MHMELEALEKKADSDNLKLLALDYFKTHAMRLLRLAGKIAPVRIEKTHKLP